MASNVFFSPSPRPQRRATSTINFGLATSTSHPPVTPLRPGVQKSKTPFGFTSPKPVLFASPTKPLSSSVFSPVPVSSRNGKGKGKEATPLTTATTTTTTTTPKRRPDLGYFAFPTGSPPSLSSSSAVSPSNNASAIATASTDGGLSQSSPPLSRGSNGVSSKPKAVPDLGSATNTPPCTPHKPPTSNGSAKPCPSPSRVLEQAEAERGEEEWVARGGVLRDRFGNVDVTKTKKVREEVERKAREKVLKERWEAYEDGWKKLVEQCDGPGSKGKAKATDEDEEQRNGVKDVGFNDIPWPIWIEDDKQKPMFPVFPSITRCPDDATPSHSQASSISWERKHKYTLQDVTIERIEDFLISPLSVLGCTETPKCRVRRSYLRWHPDKLGWLVDRVNDEDVEDVKAGVGTVLECLRRMNTRFRTQADSANSESLRSQAGTPCSSSTASGTSPPTD